MITTATNANNIFANGLDNLIFLSIINIEKMNTLLYRAIELVHGAKENKTIECGATQQGG